MLKEFLNSDRGLERIQPLLKMMNEVFQTPHRTFFRRIVDCHVVEHRRPQQEEREEGEDR